jgi:hypothetical protein
MESTDRPNRFARGREALVCRRPQVMPGLEQVSACLCPTPPKDSSAARRVWRCLGDVYRPAADGKLNKLCTSCVISQTACAVLGRP